MTPSGSSYSQLYLAGSNGKDAATATYSPGSVSFALSTGEFDQSPADVGGCTVTQTLATCPLATPLDSVLIAGMRCNDVLVADGFPVTTTVVLLGGEGGDSLTGGAESEDVLVDGPGAEAKGGDVPQCSRRRRCAAPQRWRRSAAGRRRQ